MGRPGRSGEQGDDGEQGAKGDPGEPGEAGAPGASCSVQDLGNGARLVTCSDGTEVTIRDGEAGDPGGAGVPGEDGAPGNSCTIATQNDGSKLITCTDGTSAIVRDGKPGAASFNLLAEVPEKLNVVITGVTIASPPVVSFYVADAAGRGATGLKVDGTNASHLRFTLAKLLPGSNGDGPRWQSYLNRASSGHTQATSERTGTLTDHGDGTYTYQFAADPQTVRDPVTNMQIGYDPSLTHRLSIQLSGSAGGVTLPFVNAIFDWRPAGGALTLRHDVVATASCNECHGTLRAHGSRIETRYCVSCHNPGTTDATGKSASFPGMIHGIHSAGFRKQVETARAVPAGSYDYSLAGQSFAEVTFPQALNNCLKCHDSLDAATPQGDNWKNQPTKEACGGCHAEVDFSEPYSTDKHLGGPQADNSTCAMTNCHGPDRIEIQHASEDATPHTPRVVIGKNGAAAINFAYQIDTVTVDGSGFPVVRFRILKDGVPMTLASSYPAPLNLTGGPSFLVAYASPQDGIAAPADYDNAGRKAAQPATVSVAGLVDGSQGTLTGPDGQGYYVGTLRGTGNVAAFPAGSTLRAVALQGYFSQKDFFGVGQNLARHAISVEKAVTGDPVRRAIVDSTKCSNCHEWFLGHGGNRVFATDVCVMCHVPNLTSSGRGAISSNLLTGWGTNPHPGLPDFDANASLSWPEEGMGFKTLIHSIHASGMRSSPFEFVRDRCSNASSASCLYYYDMSEVTFPGVLDRCTTCHLPGTYTTGLDPDVLPTTDVITTGNDTSAAVVQGARVAVPNATDLVTTPVAAACVGCHDTPVAASHMEEHGALVRSSRGSLAGYIETCSLCHGPGRIVDVETVHFQLR